MDSFAINFYRKDPVQIRFNDVDIVGHVNNVMYQHYYDLGRLYYFDNVLKDMIKWDEISVVLVKITTEYFAPVHLEDKIFVETKINRLGNKSLEMVQRVVSEKNGIPVIHSLSNSILSGYDRRTGNSALIPEIWKEVIRKYENNELAG
ncbi:MAG: hypothetical protein A2W91_07730 [Bacteroidetes bacterium GWF2_38_335]|nr:MAG: hypothetical protein A2W91_07730 [Bacteroidetes bacterium GWF2_38_335]OFY79056.1 MAG: hypothetical protein A2281_02990 [Bacteroidetes bacterium RIFOXYA12_FULL_38_20]HBS86138.1 acyl-CoA thioester hydrolase [Bacteroidales bacterium]